jgi:quercetin dioxygenase-like cupin family protein
MPDSTPNDTDRLRPHPEVRFAQPVQSIDLSAARAHLVAEAAAAPTRHRQTTLIRFGNTTVALFHFSQGSSLPEHLTHGTVTIHVLEGHLTVRAQGQSHALPAGQILVLAKDIKHDVHADQESFMLLTVHLEHNH